MVMELDLTRTPGEWRFALIILAVQVVVSLGLVLYVYFTGKHRPDMQRRED